MKLALCLCHFRLLLLLFLQSLVEYLAASAKRPIFNKVEVKNSLGAFPRFHTFQEFIPALPVDLAEPVTFNLKHVCRKWFLISIIYRVPNIKCHKNLILNS